MPHVSRHLAFLLLLAGCIAPSQEQATARAPESWSRRAWRSSDRPAVSDGRSAHRLRAWTLDSGEADAEQIGADVEPVTIVPEVVEHPAVVVAPEVALALPEDEPVGDEPAAVEIPALGDELPVNETPAPVETPVPFEAPTPVEEPVPLEAPPAEPAQLVDLRASIVLMWYFQRDDDPSALGTGELELAFAQYDWNKNGVVVELEFDATTGSSAPFGREPEGEALVLMGDVSPLEALLAAVDTDGDGAFSLSELAAFHGKRFAPELH